MCEVPSQADLITRLRPVHALLRPDLHVSRHLIRSQAHYVVRDPVTSQVHSISATDYQVLVRMDDSFTLSEMFDAMLCEGILETDDEERFYGFILKLQSLGLLQLPVANAQALYTRYSRRQAGRRREKLTSILFYRMPLINPDAFLERTLKFARPLFSRLAFSFWLTMMLSGAIVLWARWDDFVSPLQDILVTRNLVCMWLLLIGLKVVHEFGHAYACKLFGGNVPEMGAFFVLLTPCAYVDASSSWSFPSRLHRIIVCLGGMYFESMIAVAALFVWSWTSPSLLHSAAHQTVLLAGVVTCVMNLNPLMRYDGYYILSDILNVPNLRSRSHTQVTAILKRILLGIRAPQGHVPRSTQVQLFTYGVAAMHYKFVLVLAISAMISFKFGPIGLFGSAIYLCLATFEGFKKLTTYLCHSEETRDVRKLSILYSLIVLFGMPLALFMIPYARTQDMTGVLAAEHETRIYAQTSGFLTEESVVSGARLAAGDIVCRLQNLEQDGRVCQAEAELQLAALRSRVEQVQAPEGGSPTAHRFEHLNARLTDAQRQFDNLTVRTPVAGTVIALTQSEQPGRFVQDGEYLATIISDDWMVRCFATAEDVADMQAQIGKEVRVRLIADVGCEMQGKVASISAMDSVEAKETSLAQDYGTTAAMRHAPGELDEPRFEVVIQLDEVPNESLRHGMTVRVEYRSDRESFSRRVIRGCRQFVNKLLVI